MRSILGKIGAIWGAAGALMLLGYAIWRLSYIALDTLHYELSTLQWTVLIANMLFMAYSEGYKGFQRAYSPRVAARCLHISHHPKSLHVLLAPLFVMGYFHTTRKRLLVTYSMTTMIIGFIILMPHINQPWRGIIDAGVVVGLAWGVASLFYFLTRAFSSSSFTHSPEIATNNR